MVLYMKNGILELLIFYFVFISFSFYIIKTAVEMFGVGKIFLYFWKKTH